VVGALTATIGRHEQVKWVAEVKSVSRLPAEGLSAPRVTAYTRKWEGQARSACIYACVLASERRAGNYGN
jgi:hypothetical protein